jgi:hypothetical protein
MSALLEVGRTEVVGYGVRRGCVSSDREVVYVGYYAVCTVQLRLTVAIRADHVPLLHGRSIPIQQFKTMSPTT